MTNRILINWIGTLVIISFWTAIYLAVVSCLPEKPNSSAPYISSGPLEDIKNAATFSSCASYNWKDRGHAPAAYFQGMAKVFAKQICQFDTRSDLKLVSAARTSNDATDALSWYNSNFKSLGLSNEEAGKNTLRHAYALLIGLGMRESSGSHCTGRDAAAPNTGSANAEAGLFQTSWDSHILSPELVKLFKQYSSSRDGCFLNDFNDKIFCPESDWKNYGTGEGAGFQKLEKDCPTFSAEYAAIMLRISAGRVGHYGPLRRKEAEIKKECDQMLFQVQKIVESNPRVCEKL